MQLARSASSIDPRRFGRGPQKHFAAEALALPSRSLGDDLKLFATTFAAGFVFVSVLIG